MNPERCEECDEEFCVDHDPRKNAIRNFLDNKGNLISVLKAILPNAAILGQPGDPNFLKASEPDKIKEVVQRLSIDKRQAVFLFIQATSRKEYFRFLEHQDDVVQFVNTWANGKLIGTFFDMIVDSRSKSVPGLAEPGDKWTTSIILTGENFARAYAQAQLQKIHDQIQKSNQHHDPEPEEP